jgi:hypothetical protein
VWKYLRRNPKVEAFVAGEMRAQNAHFLQPIVRRHSMLAMQGSVQSADFVAKVAGGSYTRPLASPLDQETLGGGMVVNLLVPRPEYPQGALPPLQAMPTGLPRGSAPVAQTPQDIPTLLLR